MILPKWEKLPPELRTPAVRPYYDILSHKRCSLFFKRVFDIAVSLTLLLLLSPVLLALALAVKLDSPGPVFFRQERVTRFGRHFRIFKFRSMYQHAEEGALLTASADPRVTRLGRRMRRIRLDELAQLLDVLRGTMTLVGTRPEVPRYTARYTPEMMATLLLPAGVTNLTSIYYIGEAALLDGAEDRDKVYLEKILPQKMYYNLKELREYSFREDLRVIFLTVFAMLGRKRTVAAGQESGTIDPSSGTVE